MVTPNGPAIWGGCVPEYSGWRTFCRPGTKFAENYACRGTMLNEASKLSRYTKHYCVQMRVSGCNNHYKFVLGAGVNAKSVTNNLPILSVLAKRFVYIFTYLML